MKYYMGIDPDTTTTAWAIINERLEVVHTGIIAQSIPGWRGVENMVSAVESYTFPSTLSDVEAIVIESQQIYTSGPNRTPDADKILMVANVTGQLLTMFGGEAKLAKPAAWKQQVPKGIHHKRIFSRLGISEFKMMGKVSDPKKSYGVPTNLGHTAHGKIKASDWKHISDALGLALYAKDQS